MTSTDKTGISFRTNKHEQKVWYGRIFINNKPYKRKLGQEPAMNLKSAVKARLDLESKLRTGKSLKQSKEPLNKIFEKYLELRKHTISKSWYRTHQLNWNKYLKAEIGHKLPNDVLVMDIQKVVNNMIEANMAPATAKQIKEIITGLYKYLPNLGINGIDNIGRRVEIPKFDNTRNIELSEEEIKKLFDAIFNYYDMKFRTIFIWLLTGRRKGEVVNIRWEDIDMDAKTYTLISENSKITRSLKFTFPDLVFDALVDYGIKESGFVFPSNRKPNQAMGYTGMDYHWKNIKMQTGLKDFRMHDLRHLLGGFGVNNGYGLEKTSKALGHSGQLITQRYSLVSQDSAKSVSDGFLKKYSPQTIK
ncbi:MAG: tyrosine-type recombinase/integrase [Campylobacterota bacterium]|nr:tyrosine-type recombinase/integrase [Campylobacterota bacterium]